MLQSFLIYYEKAKEKKTNKRLRLRVKDSSEKINAHVYNVIVDEFLSKEKNKKAKS